MQNLKNADDSLDKAIVLANASLDLKKNHELGEVYGHLLNAREQLDQVIENVDELETDLFKKEQRLETYDNQKYAHHLPKHHHNLRMEMALEEFYTLLDQNGPEWLEHIVENEKITTT